MKQQIGMPAFEGCRCLFNELDHDGSSFLWLSMGRVTDAVVACDRRCELTSTIELLKHRVLMPKSHDLDPDPAVVKSVISIGRQRGLSDQYILTALMVGLQESRLNNLDHGD